MDPAQIPHDIRAILLALGSAGHEAYLVGGCVRDLRLGRIPGDWDICTGAVPEETLALFPGSVPSGLRHGTVTVKYGRERAEVTTFRAEDGYADHRRPDAVRFVSDLRTDLSRRDFTVNAMALSLSGELHDPFGGLRDLDRRVIRCVGEPEARFREDALRMLRAWRFCAQLGFRLDPAAETSIERLAHTVVFLAPERIRDELEKILLSPRPELALALQRCGLLSSFTGGVLSAGSGSLRCLPAERCARWTGLAALLLRAGCIDCPQSFFRALRLDRHSTDCCARGATLACSDKILTRLDKKRLIACFGADSARCFAAGREALGETGAVESMETLLHSGDCLCLAQLAVDGDALLSYGLRGREIGQTLQLLLDHVLRHPEQNERDILLSLLDNPQPHPSGGP